MASAPHPPTTRGNQFDILERYETINSSESSSDMVQFNLINMTVMMCLFPSVDQEFDTVSGFLLKRTKDMVNKYRQLLVREAQVRHNMQLYL